MKSKLRPITSAKRISSSKNKIKKDIKFEKIANLTFTEGFLPVM